MSRTVHILKLYQQHSEFFKFNDVLMREKIYHTALNCKRYNELLRELINYFNTTRNHVVGPDYHKALTFPRFKIIVALLAQKEGFKKSFNIPFIFTLSIHSLPERFRLKFQPLMVTGIWLLGIAIEDSLSEDPDVNCGNPFEFLDGDLGFWWAALVVLDWFKYRNKAEKGTEEKEFYKCVEFYNCCLSRKYKYYQNSGLSSMGRAPEQFLSPKNLLNFYATINFFNSSDIFNKVKCKKSTSVLSNS